MNKFVLLDELLRFKNIPMLARDWFYHIWWQEILGGFVGEIFGWEDSEFSSYSLTKEDEKRLGLSWIIMMTIVAIYNVYLVIALWYKPYDRNLEFQFQWKLRFFSTLYVLISSFRAVMPRVYESRICFWGHWLSYPGFGRTVAFIAEVSVGYQIYLALDNTLRQLQLYYTKGDRITLKTLRVLSFACFALVATANCLSNVCIITTNNVFCACENSLWVCMEICAFLVCLYIGIKFLYLYRIHKNPLFLKNARKCFQILLFCFLLALYTAISDVPMYLRRYREDTMVGKQYLGFSEGVMDSLQCSSVSSDYLVWKEEISWLTGYFTFGLWASNHLAANPFVVQEFKHD